MIPFTDDDLKQLKEHRALAENVELEHRHGNKLDALIHRLEAAEKVIDDIAGDDLPGESYIAWRKTAGKSC